MWYADTIFATGYQASRSQDFITAYQNIKEAILINDSEPLYYDEFSYPAAQLSVGLSADESQATLSAQLAKEAIAASDQAVSISPNNVVYWKTRTRVFYTLSQIDESYLTDAKQALEKAAELAPTDPKIIYNLALIYDRWGISEKVIPLLEQAAKLKPDYRDAYYALALFYEKDGKKDEAKKTLDYILTKINPNDEDAKKLMEEL